MMWCHSVGFYLKCPTCMERLQIKWSDDRHFKVISLFFATSKILLSLQIEFGQVHVTDRCPIISIVMSYDDGI